MLTDDVDIYHLRVFSQKPPNRLIHHTTVLAPRGAAVECDLSHCRHGFFLP